MKIRGTDIRLFFAVGLTLTGFLITVTAFTQVYKQHNYLPYPEAQTISEEARNKEITFIATGDIMLSRNVARHAEKAGRTDWIWDNIAGYLRSADFVFGNLEGTTNGTDVYSYQKVLIFNALPKLIETLSGVNFSMLNLANNHAMDQGEKGLKITQELLTKIGIQFTGTGTNENDTWEPKIVEKNGIKIAFIGASYAAYNDNGTRQSPLIARMQDTKNLIESIQKAKSSADIVIVTMHAGLEYTREPTPLQTDFAHTAIDNGADIVIGAHPHWIQGIEQYSGKYIFYSLGNFIFDQEFSAETKEGMTLKISLKKDEIAHIEQIELIPIIIENYGQPRLANAEEKSRILESIGQKNDIIN